MRAGFLLLVALAGCAPQRLQSARAFHYLPYYGSGPAPEADCGSQGNFRYCVYRAPKGAPEDTQTLVYFLHYAGGDELSWKKLPISRVYYAYFRERKLPAPRVVAVSYGPYWTLMEQPAQVQPALLEPFLKEAMPFIEAKTGTPQRRYIWGMSQGSYNGAELALKAPGLWDRLVLSCPAFYSISVYAPEKELREFTRRTGARWEDVLWGVDLLGKRVGGPAAWDSDNPLALAHKAERFPPTLIQANREDSFGFYDGARVFAQRLREKNQPVIWSPAPGGHCLIDAREAAAYLASLSDRHD